MPAVRTAVCVTTVAAIAVFIQAVGATHDLDDLLEVTGVTLAASEDVGRDVVKETYRATLRHSGPPGSRDFARVRATLRGMAGLSIPGFIEIVDADVSFGTVRPGETIDSLDTVTIKRNRRLSLNLRQWRWEVAGRHDLVVPNEWTGTWRFTITRSDPADGHIEQTLTTTTVLGLREPIGFSLLPPDVFRCRWHGDDNALDAICEGSARVAWCVTTGSAEFSIDRDGEQAQGLGRVHVTQQGNCPSGAHETTDAIAIAGTRLTRDADDEPLSFGLLPTLSTNPYFSVLLAAAMSDEPSSVDDCPHGGWRRFTRPRFRDDNACRAYLHTRGHHDQNGGVR